MIEKLINQIVSENLTEEQEYLVYKITDPPKNWLQLLYSDSELSSVLTLEIPVNDLFEDCKETKYIIDIYSSFVGENLKCKKDNIDGVSELKIDVIVVTNLNKLESYSCNLELIDIERVKELVLNVLINGWGTDGMYDIDYGKDNN